MSLESILKSCRQRTAIIALLALLLGQWALLTHVHDQNSSLPDEACWLCIHAQHDGNALPSLGLVFTAVPTDAPQPWLEHVSHVGGAFRHFNPRAPPLS